MNNIFPIIKYSILTVKHKWFVFLYGLKLGVPIFQLLIHDWSKFTPSELPHYARNFLGDKSDPLGFAKCWLHHQNINPHHWEYWIPRTGNGGAPIEIPEKYVREMIADWFAASRAYDGCFPKNLQEWAWYQKNFNSVYEKLHSETRKKVLDILSDIFPFKVVDGDTQLLENKIAGWSNPAAREAHNYEMICSNDKLNHGYS